MSNPIEGATVELDGVTRVTGSAGGCNFSDVTFGAHTVTVSKDGFESLTQTINVDSENGDFNLELTPVSSGAYNITVFTHSDEEPLTGTTVHLKEPGAGQPSMTQTTGSDGNAVFNNVTAGTYELEVIPGDPLTYVAVEGISITVDATHTEFSVELLRIPPSDGRV